MNKILFFIASFVIIAISFSSCLPDKSNEWEDYLAELERQQKLVHEQYLADSTLISHYLIENDSLAIWDENSGLFYNIIEPGSEYKPSLNSFIEVKYTGSLLDGTIFSQTEENESLIYILGNLIAGWQIGLTKIGRNGKIDLYIPSYLGYADQVKPNIPANSVLIFQIELISFY